MLLRDDWPLWTIGFMQFASNKCGDPVCFDLQNPTRDDDFPIAESLGDFRYCRVTTVGFLS
ncbi:MAG: hypothetical protein CMJ78_25180 [Planctomycetaceae bacterium]|nr:hypothetical protein [Planctomycetaceae bacterium]